MCAIATILWLLVGSFFNVVIHRLPRGQSIVFPPSHCVSCGVRLSPKELIPFFSYVWQKGRCRHCGAAISLRYPLVELLTAVLLSLIWYLQGGSPSTYAYLIFASLLIVISFIDIDHMLIPDQLLVAGVGVWLVLQLLSPFIAWSDALAGSALAFALMLVIFVLSRGGMGFGDVKLVGLIGLYLGLSLTLLSLFLAFVLGAAVGLTLILLRLKKGKSALPFGPFLALGAYLAMVWGGDIIRWYLQISGF
ncbi:MAG: prepilin peptidase [Peptococcaceae bacterium]|nr:prepilin peptidase [Peptococcaceae bacterium]